jgi:hypothetical protein
LGLRLNVIQQDEWDIYKNLSKDDHIFEKSFSTNYNWKGRFQFYGKWNKVNLNRLLLGVSEWNL